MLDEVQTGNGRTGSYFAYQGLGIARMWSPPPRAWATACRSAPAWPGARPPRCWAQGTTAPPTAATRWPAPRLWQWSRPLATSDLCANAIAMGKLIHDSLRSRQRAAIIAEIRGRGLMLGIELQQDCSELVSARWQAGLLINVTAGNTIRLLPPLIICEQKPGRWPAVVAELIRERFSRSTPTVTGSTDHV